jgi:hypothetical protein
MLSRCTYPRRHDYNALLADRAGGYRDQKNSPLKGAPIDGYGVFQADRIVGHV